MLEWLCIDWRWPEVSRGWLWFVLMTLGFIGYKYHCIKKLPPGPWGLPIVGCLHRMSRGAPHSWYLQLSAQYGDLFSLKLGGNLVVCIGSVQLLKKMFHRIDSTGRPGTPLNNLLEGLGVVLSDRHLWRRQRSFLLEKFRALSTTNQLEQHILLEIGELKTTLNRLQGKPLDPAVVLGRHIHNVITQLMMSFRFEENDPDFITFNERVTRGMELYGSIHIGEHLTWYMKLPGKMQVLEEIKRNLADVSEFHLAHIRKRQEKRRLATHSEPSDLLDFYLDALEKEAHNESKLFVGVEAEKQIVQVMNDLFSAGMETSRSAILWSLVMMMREPAVAAAVRSELATVVTPGDLVTLDHRLRLPYVEAAMYETMRRVPIVPLGTTHVNHREWQVNNYTIPAGTHVVPLLNKILMNPADFPEPERFLPERFIKKDSVVLPENYIPFGVGRRVCLGEKLAKMEIFLIFANLMNSFEFHIPEGENMPDMEGFLGSTHAPKPYQIIFNPILRQGKI